MELKGTIFCASTTTEIINQINSLLPQLNEFINQFNTIIIENNINVITDAGGNMSIDAPIDMPDDKANSLGKRIGILDGLINTRSKEINDLFQQAMKIDKQSDSVILTKLDEFTKLKNSYKH
jgi:xanthine dehydrogenase iron-sulfur cluster and FAD-binding subunit A